MKVFVVLLIGWNLLFGLEGLASYYTTKESKGRMANGKKLNDWAMTGASWKFPLGSKVEVCRVKTKKCVVVRITDRGPHKRFKNRIIDLTKGAFMRLAPLKVGLIKVRVRKIE